MTLPARRLYLPTDHVLAARHCAQTLDPVGYAGDLQAVAADLRNTARLLRETLDSVRTLDTSTWCGVAGAAFQEKVKQPKKLAIEDVPPRFEGYADALTGYANQLEESRARIRRARQDVLAALDAHARVLAAPKADPAAVQRAADACGVAARGFGAAIDAWVGQVNAAISKLKHVNTHDDLRNPHGLRKLAADIGAVAKGLSEWLDDISTLLAVLAVVSIVLCPALSSALFAASSWVSAAKLSVDLTRAQFGDVDAHGLADAALGALPFAGRGLQAGRKAAEFGQDAKIAIDKAITREAVQQYIRPSKTAPNYFHSAVDAIKNRDVRPRIPTGKEAGSTAVEGALALGYDATRDMAEHRSVIHTGKSLTFEPGRRLSSNWLTAYPSDD